MADPRNELADIIVPVAPQMAASASGLSFWGWTVGLIVVVVLAALLAWRWHRRRFARALRAIAAAVDRQQATPVELAGRLDAWARVRFRLARLDAATCPQELDAIAWADWVHGLTQLRFAPSPANGYEDLAGLCETARQWKQHD